MKIALPFLLIFSAIVMCSCKVKSENDNANNIKNDESVSETINAKILENPILTDYKLYISQLDSTNIKTVTIGAKRYKEIFIRQSYSTCDSAFDIFNKYYERMEDLLNQAYADDSTNFDAFAIEQANPLPQTLKNYRKILLNNGFDIDTEEGITYIKQDRNFIAKYFYNIISPTMKAYQIQLNIENAEGFVRDASIVISPAKLIDRLIWYDKFIYENPEFQYRNECNQSKKKYLSILFYGVDNTPLYSSDNPTKVSDYFEKAYQYLISKYPGARITALLKPYYDALEKNQTDISKNLVLKYTNEGIIDNQTEQ